MKERIVASDGSINYGNGAVGPSIADQLRAHNLQAKSESKGASFRNKMLPLVTAATGVLLLACSNRQGSLTSQQIADLCTFPDTSVHSGNRLVTRTERPNVSPSVDPRSYSFTDIISSDGTRKTLGEGYESTWSPDGLKVAIYDEDLSLVNGRVVNTKQELSIVDLNGNGERVYSGEAYVPQWSPDGKNIAFMNRSLQLHALNVDTKEVVLLDTLDNVTFFMGIKPIYTWAPDSKEIAIMGNELRWDDESPALKLEIGVYVVKIDGSPMRRIAKTSYMDPQEIKWIQTDEGSQIIAGRIREGKVEVVTINDSIVTTKDISKDCN